jgi:hypothetical protein
MVKDPTVTSKSVLHGMHNNNPKPTVEPPCSPISHNLDTSLTVTRATEIMAFRERTTNSQPHHRG